MGSYYFFLENFLLQNYAYKFKEFIKTHIADFVQSKRHPIYLYIWLRTYFVRNLYFTTSSGDLLSLKATKISSRQKRRLVCFVARVQTYSVIQSTGTTPPSGTRLVLSMAPFACLSRTKLAYPLLPPKAGDRVYQVTYFSS